MAKKRTFKPVKPTLAMGQFAPDTVHTVELSQLFAMFHNPTVRGYAITECANDWNGGLNWTQAVKAAELGQWDAPAIERITLPDVVGPSDDCTFYYDVTGHSLDIGSFCSGEPEYWQVQEPIHKPVGRIIRFAIEIGGSQLISADSIRNRGEAIIALVHSLELQGHSVEISIVRAFQNRQDSNYKFLLPIKQAGQALDIKRLQFMLGHPSFYRRCLFALAEIAQGMSLHDCSTSTMNYKPKGYIHIPHQAGLGMKRESMEWAKQFAQTLDAQN